MAGLGVPIKQRPWFEEFRIINEHIADNVGHVVPTRTGIIREEILRTRNGSSQSDIDAAIDFLDKFELDYINTPGINTSALEEQDNKLQTRMAIILAGAYLAYSTIVIAIIMISAVLKIEIPEWGIGVIGTVIGFLGTKLSEIVSFIFGSSMSERSTARSNNNKQVGGGNDYSHLAG